MKKTKHYIVTLDGRKFQNLRLKNNTFQYRAIGASKEDLLNFMGKEYRSQVINIEEVPAPLYKIDLSDKQNNTFTSQVSYPRTGLEPQRLLFNKRR